MYVKKALIPEKSIRAFFKTQLCKQFGVKIMIGTVKKVVYKAFGLNILSEIPLPELPQANVQENLADIIIEIADLSKLWFQLANEKARLVVREGLFMFEIPNTALFCVQEGNRITVSPIEGCEESKIRLYLLGTCMGALLMQRKILPLHGSAVAIDGKAYAFVGDSGAGKSTLASAFLNRGYQLLTDDVIAVSLSRDNIPFVTPSYPQQKLWQESLKEFGMEASQYRPIYERETKYTVPVTSEFSTEPLPLAGVFELVKTESEDIELHRIQGLERLHTLFCHTYRNFLISRFGLREWHFSTSASFINQIDVFQLRRPTSSFTAHQLVSLILNTLNKGK